jgi:hypothetical protein
MQRLSYVERKELYNQCPKPQRFQQLVWLYEAFDFVHLSYLFIDNSRVTCKKRMCLQIR